MTIQAILAMYLPWAVVDGIITEEQMQQILTRIEEWNIRHYSDEYTRVRDTIVLPS